jgi:carbon starvation protein
MLLEGFVALIALATIMIVAPRPGTPPGQVYGDGIGRFLALLIGEKNLLFAQVFGAMAFSTFIFDTLDVTTRLGRYVFEELFDWRTRASAAVGTLAVMGLPAVLILTAPDPAPGKPPAYLAFWTLFGTSNQLLAALTLLGVSVWLRKAGKRTWFTLVPMAFVLTITVTALVLQAWKGLTAFRGADGAVEPTLLINGVVSVALLGLAGVVVVEAARAWRRPSGHVTQL